MAKDLKIEIPSVDEIFKLSTNRGKAENVVMIPLNKITDLSCKEVFIRFNNI